MPVVRLRGTVQSVTQSSLLLKMRRGELVELALPASLTLSEVYPIKLSDIKAGSYIGVGVGVGGRPQARNARLRSQGFPSRRVARAKAIVRWIWRPTTP